MGSSCCSCLKSNASFVCVGCNDNVCKKCAEFVTIENFLCLTEMPEGLTSGSYCPSCYETKAQAVLQEHNEMLDAAREVHVFFRGQGQERRSLFLRKNEAPIKVTDCLDADDVVLRLAFMAAKNNFNTIIDVEADSEKIHDGSYTILKWHGTAIPCRGDLHRLNRTVDAKFETKSPSRR